MHGRAVGATRRWPIAAHLSQGVPDQVQNGFRTFEEAIDTVQGVQVGIFTNWSETCARVKKVLFSVFQGFNSYQEALFEFLLAERSGVTRILTLVIHTCQSQLEATRCWYCVYTGKTTGVFPMLSDTHTAAGDIDSMEVEVFRMEEGAVEGYQLALARRDVFCVGMLRPAIDLHEQSTTSPTSSNGRGFKLHHSFIHFCYNSHSFIHLFNYLLSHASLSLMVRMTCSGREFSPFVIAPAAPFNFGSLLLQALHAAIEHDFHEPVGLIVTDSSPESPLVLPRIPPSTGSPDPDPFFPLSPISNLIQPHTPFTAPRTNSRLPTKLRRSRSNAKNNCDAKQALLKRRKATSNEYVKHKLRPAISKSYAQPAVLGELDVNQALTPAAQGFVGLGGSKQVDQVFMVEELIAKGFEYHRWDGCTHGVIMDSNEHVVAVLALPPRDLPQCQVEDSWERGVMREAVEALESARAACRFSEEELCHRMH
ncbi:hypothetical protein JAAARDRAFT_47243 [Jaapia argillacea MUCL 33604]|uniref:Ribonuclease H1 N-terminal domain-containing protein n=1 Tax=Jaapia argillacea MUCL 33604 TaxID=933084 RepID=A0A067PVZ1_9AGAM|nr:hypothetical protein JAAARDRAFT_47243 [Jaapia argillacea MUCL 33604]